MLAIDGAMGEGGGQLLRTAVGLALATGQAIRVSNVRARREKPGLRPQHCAAVAAAGRIGAARVSGNEVGSPEITFEPQAVHAGSYEHSIGTAGSVTLVLQTVLPALLLADAPSTVVIEGGTHNPLAPSWDFLVETFFPLLREMGADVSGSLERHGFYPRGGGRVRCAIRPCAKLVPIELLERGPILDVRARALIARLPRHVAEREIAVIQKSLGISASACEIVDAGATSSPGNALFVAIRSARVTELVTALGRRGLPAEQVAEAAAGEAREYLGSGAPVGTHLADQLLVPLALAEGGAFRSARPTLHTTTNARVIEAVLGVAMSFREDRDGTWLTEVGAARARPPPSALG